MRYREILWSDLYPGNRLSVECLQPAVTATENALELAPERYPRTVWRLDAGFGTDEQVCWLLDRNYQVIAKGHSGMRAKALAKQVKRWYPYRDAWQATVAAPLNFGREVKVVVKRRLKKDKFLHSFYLSTLKLPSNAHLLGLYDQRGAMEVEPFRNDKQGLHLSSRRKHGFRAQQGLVLLTDLAHNLLADFYHNALVGSSFEGYGPKRIVRDLFSMEGRIHLEAGQLTKVELAAHHPHAQELLNCLVRYRRSY